MMIIFVSKEGLRRAIISGLVKGEDFVQVKKLKSLVFIFQILL
jgi:hypothetical protein